MIRGMKILYHVFWDFIVLIPVFLIRLEVKDLVKGWINKKVDTGSEQLLNELGNDSWELTEGKRG